MTNQWRLAQNRLYYHIKELGEDFDESWAACILIRIIIHGLVRLHMYFCTVLMQQNQEASRTDLTPAVNGSDPKDRWRSMESTMADLPLTFMSMDQRLLLGPALTPLGFIEINWGLQWLEYTWLWCKGSNFNSSTGWRHFWVVDLERCLLISDP